jgi:hypothetical protein
MSDESTPSIDGQVYDFEEIARLDVTIKTVRRMIARAIELPLRAKMGWSARTRYDAMIVSLIPIDGQRGASRMPGAACRWPLGLSVIASRGRREPGRADLFDERNAGADWSVSSRQKTACDNKARSLEASRRHHAMLITLRDSFDNGGGQETR